MGNLTRQNDFKRAGIDLVDSHGRVADLHALRATLATNLARASVTPQVAQRILRHSDYRTTLKHYTVLGLVDTAAAVAKILSIAPTRGESLRATGTDDVIPHKAFPHDSRDIQQRTRLDFSRRQWVINWCWRRPRTCPLRGEGSGLVTEKMKEEKEKRELRIPHGTEADGLVVAVGREAVAPRRAAVVGGAAPPGPAAAAKQTVRASRGS